MIAFSHYSAKNDISGVTTWLQRLLLRLHHDGIPVSLLLHHLENNIQESSLLQPLLEAGIHVKIEPQPPYSEDGVRSTLAFLNRHKPQAFFPQCLAAMYYAASIAGRAGLPWAMTIHSDDPVYWAIAETIPPEANGGLMVGVSDYICQLAIIKGLADLPQAIPCGVPVPQQKATFLDSPFRVAFSGRVVEEQKRISLVLAGMAQACLRDSRIECWVIGDGAAMAHSRQWIIEQRLGDRIHFLGRVGTIRSSGQTSPMSSHIVDVRL
jgi:colanic acid/amylovoran biosynthesis glycosyltransferase